MSEVALVKTLEHSMIVGASSVYFNKRIASPVGDNKKGL